MVSFSFNTLQQKHFFSVTLCKSPLTLTPFKFPSFSSCSTFSPQKHTLKPSFFPFLVVRAHVSHTETKVSITDHTLTKTMNLRTAKENVAGFSFMRDMDERTQRKSLKNLGGGSVVEKTERKLTKDKNRRKNLGFRRSKEMGSGKFSLRTRDENMMVYSLESVCRSVVNEKMEKKPRKVDDNQVGKEDKGKGSKKNKDESSEVQLRPALDMCSKRGDVLGAIQLYDKALKEGIRLRQYHYTVLLYLCSSAARGVIHPAKSGSGSRILNPLDLSNGVSNLNNILVSNEQLVDFGTIDGTPGKMELNSSSNFQDFSSTSNEKNLSSFSNGFKKSTSQLLDRPNSPIKDVDDFSNTKDDQEEHKIQVGEDFKKYALQRGFEVYEKMCSDNVPMNEAALTSVARMAVSMGNGDLAFDMVKQMKPLGINARLRSYGPALSYFCDIGDIEKAFAVEKHMLEHGVHPEEHELLALLRVSVGAGKGDKVYYLLHKLRTSLRKVSSTTADLIVKWFNSKAASRVGKTKWDTSLIKEAIENGGGGWHGQGWLGKGRWNVSYTTVGTDGLCDCCGERLALIDLDPKETENFAESVASIAIKKEKNSSFQKFQKWLDYYGPFEAVVDAANVGIYNQKRFVPSKVSAVVNGIRQKFPSKKWPLIVLHNKRITGRKMDAPVNKALIEKWKNADALYATPTGSNDDWYWLYAAIKFKCLIVTNDEMRDHTFQLLGNDFFPKWKERHQESDQGHWHVPIVSERDYEVERTWLCITRAKLSAARKDSVTSPEESQSLQYKKGHSRSSAEIKVKSQPNHANHENAKSQSQEIYKNLRDILSASLCSNHQTILPQLEAAEMFGNCIIDFQI
nr:proteinaceous RNase P 1, chloroplastic/mitochondrial-like isoform X2 [Quercus suber]